MLENVIKSHCISLLLKTRCLSFTVAYRQHGKHALADVEGVSPVVVQNHSVVFPDSQQPPAQRLGEEGEGEIRIRVSGNGGEDAWGFSLGESVARLRRAH